MLKRKIKVLSLSDKLKIVNAFECGKSRNEIQSEFGLPESTFYKIIKSKDFIKSQSCEERGDIKRRRLTKFPDIENCLLEWIKQTADQNIPIDGRLLKQKSKDFAIKLGIQNFSASNGWYEGFKKRHGKAFKTPAGENDSVDQGLYNQWTEDLPSLLEGYNSYDYYNSDETAMLMKYLPEETLTFDNEKQSKEHFSIAQCANMTALYREKLTCKNCGKCSKNKKNHEIHIQACYSGIEIKNDVEENTEREVPQLQSTIEIENENDSCGVLIEPKEEPFDFDDDDANNKPVQEMPPTKKLKPLLHERQAAFDNSAGNVPLSHEATTFSEGPTISRNSTTLKKQQSKLSLVPSNLLIQQASQSSLNYLDDLLTQKIVNENVSSKTKPRTVQSSEAVSLNSTRTAFKNKIDIPNSILDSCAYHYLTQQQQQQQSNIQQRLRNKHQQQNGRFKRKTISNKQDRTDFLLRQMVKAQTENNEIQKENNKIQRELLNLQRERLEFEKTIVEKLFLKVPSLLSKSDQQQKQEEEQHPNQKQPQQQEQRKHQGEHQQGEQEQQEEQKQKQEKQ